MFLRGEQIKTLLEKFEVLEDPRDIRGKNIN